MDKIDRDIIDLLRHDGRLSYRELGEAVCLSANTVAERVRKLVGDGVLEGFAARVNLAAVNLQVQAMIDVKLFPGTAASHFEAVLATIPGVVESFLLTGSYDYLLRVACRDQAGLVQVIEALRSRAGVQDTHSRMILRQADIHAPLPR